MKRIIKVGIAGALGLTLTAGAIPIGSGILANMQALQAYDRVRTQARTVSTPATPTPTITASPTPEPIGPKALPTPKAAEPRPVIFSELKETAPNALAWIAAFNTLIDYPIVQADNNTYYLNHLYNGAENNAGAIFIDSRNSKKITDRNTIVYGKSTKNGTMFSGLLQYQSQDFYDANPNIILQTETAKYKIELIAGLTIPDSESVPANEDKAAQTEYLPISFNTETDFQNYLNLLRSQSTFTSSVTAAEGDQLISLCVCDKNQNYLLVGKLVEQKPKRLYTH